MTYMLTDKEINALGFDKTKTNKLKKLVPELKQLKAKSAELKQQITENRKLYQLKFVEIRELIG